MRTLDVFKQVTLKCSRIQMSRGSQRCNDTSYPNEKLLCCLLKGPEALQEVLHLSNSISDIKLWKWSGIETPVWLLRFSLFKVSLYSGGYLELQKIPLCFCISLVHRSNIDFRNYVSDHRTGQRSNELFMYRTSTMQLEALQYSPQSPFLQIHHPTLSYLLSSPWAGITSTSTAVPHTPAQWLHFLNYSNDLK